MFSRANSAAMMPLRVAFGSWNIISCLLDRVPSVVPPVKVQARAMAALPWLVPAPMMAVIKVCSNDALISSTTCGGKTS